MQHNKSAKKRLKTHLRSLQHYRVRVAGPVALAFLGPSRSRSCTCHARGGPFACATSGHWARFALLSRVPHFRLPFALPFADVDMVCVPTWFNIVMIIVISRFYDVFTLDTNFYSHLHVLISINLEDNHWVVARVDFRRKQIFIYDLMKEFREDKTYGQLLKPLQVIFPQ